jgi:hypothetical protein
MIKKTTQWILMALLLISASYAQQPNTPGYEERRSNRGIIQYSAIDSNQDGKMDTFYYYDTQGRLERQEIDSNHNGKIDIIIRYSDGMYITSIEKDIDGDGSFREKRSF